MLIKLRKAQNTAEYAILIGLVIGAAIAMQTYVKRALQGRFQGGIHYMVNATPEVSSNRFPYQYEPYYMQQEQVGTQQSSTNTSIHDSGITNIESFSGRTTESGSQNILGTSAAGAND